MTTPSRAKSAEAQAQEKKKAPDRLTFHHSFAISAGRKCIEKIGEELDNPQAKAWADEWALHAKERDSVGPLEFLAQKTQTGETKLLAIASRLTSVPPIDCEMVIGALETHYMIDGLPLTLLSGSNFGAKTLVHCIPFLETVIDKELICDIYQAIRVDFVLTTYDAMLKHVQRAYNSGRAQHRMLLLGDGESSPKFKKEIELLKARELLPRDFPEEATRTEIMGVIEDEKPQKGNPGETEWWSLCSDHPYLKLAPIASTKELAELLSPTCQKKHGVVPVAFFGGLLTLASKRGIQSTLKQEITNDLSRNVKLTTVLTSDSIINDILNSNLSSNISTTELARQIQVDNPESENSAEVVDLEELADTDEASIVRVVQSILVGSINKNATDIHIAAHEDRTWIRYRIDGTMVDAEFQLPPQFWKPVISRIKIMGNIDIKYSPVPQDGKFHLKVAGIDYDIRINTCATMHGEKAILRVQKKDLEVPTLESLGFKPHEKKLIEDFLDTDHGMLVICGPTGSGKSLAFGTPVIKYDGTVVAVEELNDGDVIMGPDSTPRIVTGTNTEEGVIYEIIPENGDKWACNDVHIMTLQKTEADGTKIVRDIPLPELIEAAKRGEAPGETWKLLRVPVKFPPNPKEEEVTENDLWKTGRNAGGDKQEPIPQWMLTLSSDSRETLLQGVLSQNKGPDLLFANLEIAKSVKFLAGSLGWNTSRIETFRGGIHKLTLEEPDGENPTSGWTFRKIENGKYRGIMVDQDERFLLGDFTVTHNTKTLSATMYKIDRSRWNVITAENPVEVRIPNVEQTPIDGTQMTFGKFVPAALRQDPDYIMIGETRDKETTQEVIRAAITGHIVMTTLHTNSAAGVPARLIDMGGEPFLITDSLKVVIAQRLIKKLCLNCSKPSTFSFSPGELERYGIDPSWLEKSEGLLEPVGCKMCNNTGYLGRTAISEGYTVSHRIREIILKEDGNTEEIRKEMARQGGKSLFQQAIELAGARITSLSEALAIRNMDG